MKADTRRKVPKMVKLPMLVIIILLQQMKRERRRLEDL
jgi:hypothetical protein